jgi:hypothetical protein
LLLVQCVHRDCDEIGKRTVTVVVEVNRIDILESISVSPGTSSIVCLECKGWGPGAKSRHLGSPHLSGCFKGFDRAKKRVWFQSALNPVGSMSSAACMAATRPHDPTPTLVPALDFGRAQLFKTDVCTR